MSSFVMFVLEFEFPNRVETCRSLHCFKKKRSEPERPKTLINSELQMKNSVCYNNKKSVYSTVL